MEEAKGDSTQQYLTTSKFIASLHGEFDLLVKYFEVRKQASASGVGSLMNAKALPVKCFTSLISWRHAVRLCAWRAPNGQSISVDGKVMSQVLQ